MTKCFPPIYLVQGYKIQKHTLETLNDNMKIPEYFTNIIITRHGVCVAGNSVVTTKKLCG